MQQGYIVDKQRFEKNAEELQHALELIKKTAQSPELNTNEGRGLIEIISRYTQTFLWLQRYDEGLLDEPDVEEGGILPTPNEAMALLNELKTQLMAKGEATALFANPRGDGLASVLGNLEQTVFGEPAYPSIESKAAHFLYFMVKNHPFTDVTIAAEAKSDLMMTHRFEFDINGRIAGAQAQVNTTYKFNGNNVGSNMAVMI